MNRRLAITVGVLVLLWLAVAVSLRAWRARERARRLTELLAVLHEGGAPRRAETAGQILKLDPGLAAVRLVAARALLEGGQPVAARDTLGPLLEPGSAHLGAARALVARSYLVEARRLAESTRTGTADMDAPKVRDLLDRAATYRGDLATDPARAALAATLHALDAEVRLEMARRGVPLPDRASTASPQASPPTDAQSTAGSAPPARPATEAAAADPLQAPREALVQACRNAIDADPEHSGEARAILVRTWIAEGAFDRARQEIRQVAALGQLERAIAGPVAAMLLDLEAEHAEPAAAGDLDLARRLLQRAEGDKAANLSADLAGVTVLLREGRFEAASAQAQRMLAEHPGHSRTTSLLARALIEQGKAQDAVLLVERLRRREDSAPLAYVQALAKLAQDDQRGAEESLNSAIDQDKQCMPAHLALAELLADQHRWTEAATPIGAALALNPRHPHARDLQVRLLVANCDRLGLAALLDAGAVGDREPGPADIALVAAMVLDDTAGVGRACQARLATDCGDTLGLLARAWGASDGLTRVAVAGAALRALDRRVDADPLRQPEPAEAPAPVRLIPGLGGSDSLDGRFPTRQLLWECPYSPWREQRARDLVGRALGTWPADRDLTAIARRLDLWLDWRQRTPSAPPDLDLAADEPTALLVRLIAALNGPERAPAAADEALAALLGRHPWARLGLLLALADAAEGPDATRADRVLDAARTLNADLALLGSAHLAYARGQPDRALNLLEQMLREQPGDAELQLLAADLLARTYVASARIEMAVNVFENLAIAAPDSRFESALAAAEVLSDDGRHAQAVAPLVGMLGQEQIPPAVLQRVLVRAEAEVSGQHLLNLIDAMQPAEALQPVVQLCRARLLTRLGHFADADATLTFLEQRWPDPAVRCRQAPAVMFARARLDGQQGRTEQAQATYRRLLEAGGHLAAAAQQRLRELDAPAAGERQPAGAEAGGN